MGSNGEIIKAAAELIRERAPSDDPHVDAPASWRSIGLDLQYDGQLIVRLRPAGDAVTDIEVFRWGALLASEHLRRYRSATRLAELVEDVHRRALKRA